MTVIIKLGQQEDSEASIWKVKGVNLKDSDEAIIVESRDFEKTV